jgi:pimeloyl-ACP methyl ester carboxylesterase
MGILRTTAAGSPGSPPRVRALFRRARPAWLGPRMEWSRRREFFVEASAGRPVTVKILTAGAGARTVVLIHGIGVSPRYFEPLAARLAEESTVHAVELPGYGSTQEPRSGLSIPEFAQAAAAALDRAGIQGAVLAGQSMGCQVAAEVAARNPGLVSSLVLLGPTVNDRERSARMQALRLGQDVLRESALVSLLVFTDYARTGIRWYLKTLPAMLEHRLEDALARVACPVWLVRGSRDPIAPRDWLERLEQACPQARIGEVPGEPHVMMYHSAEATARFCLPEEGHEAA